MWHRNRNNKWNSKGKVQSCATKATNSRASLPKIDTLPWNLQCT